MPPETLETPKMVLRPNRAYEMYLKEVRKTPFRHENRCGKTTAANRIPGRLVTLGNLFLVSAGLFVLLFLEPAILLFLRS